MISLHVVSDTISPTFTAFLLPLWSVYQSMHKAHTSVSYTPVSPTLSKNYIDNSQKTMCENKNRCCSDRTIIIVSLRHGIIRPRCSCLTFIESLTKSESSHTLQGIGGCKYQTHSIPGDKKVHLPTNLPYKSTIHLGKYTSPMDYMGNLLGTGFVFFDWPSGWWFQPLRKILVKMGIFPK